MRLRLWVVVIVLVSALAGYSFFPARSELWLRISIRNQDRETLKEALLRVSDRSHRVLATARLDLHTTYEDGNRRLAGSAGWHADVAERILEASNDGLVVSISSPLCKPKELRLDRNDVRSSYDPPYFQLGGHGTGYHAAAVHYRLSCNLDLDCEAAAR